jgi:hypothetical protein
MISKLWILKYIEGSGSGVIEVLSQHFRGGTGGTRNPNYGSWCPSHDSSELFNRWFLSQPPSWDKRRPAEKPFSSEVRSSEVKAEAQKWGQTLRSEVRSSDVKSDAQKRSQKLRSEVRRSEAKSDAQKWSQTLRREVRSSEMIANTAWCKSNKSRYWNPQPTNYSTC